ncbi:MAG: hypothetical protein HY391_00395 [Deltaproteobacteria bacterium]|nr:hypothetical protein [Deltaproteobacteria bacterium]
MKNIKWTLFAIFFLTYAPRGSDASVTHDGGDFILKSEIHYSWESPFEAEGELRCEHCDLGVSDKCQFQLTESETGEVFHLETSEKLAALYHEGQKEIFVKGKRVEGLFSDRLIVEHAHIAQKEGLTHKGEDASQN